MEELIIKRSTAIQYSFYPDLIIIKKNDNVKHEIKLSDIEKITYHPRFMVSDIFAYSGDRLYYFPKAFNIVQRTNKPKIISLKISNEDFIKIKNIFKCSIQII